MGWLATFPKKLFKRFISSSKTLNLLKPIEQKSTTNIDYQHSEAPVLFIQKFQELVSTCYVHPSNTNGRNDTLFTPSKVSEIVKAINDSDSFEQFMNSQVGKKELLVNTEAVRKNNEIYLVRNPSVEEMNWNSVKLDPYKLPSYYMMLSKSRLTMFVCLTAASGYGIAPGSFDPSVFFYTTVGTGLIACAANATNQFFEMPYDAQMKRTKNRILVRHLLTSTHAFTFAVVTACMGLLILSSQTNWISASLGGFNLVLYTCIYTPLKRISSINTWVGSVVGAIPPVIGWVGATGSLDPGAFLIAGIMYTWQFPHFNALSWNLRPDYSKAGYRMMCVTDPLTCRKVALRHSIGCLLVCSVAAPLLQVTELTFAFDSLPLNVYLVFLAWKFFRHADSSASRKLFRYTLIHLPLLMILLFVSKKRVINKS